MIPRFSLRKVIQVRSILFVFCWFRTGSRGHASSYRECTPAICFTPVKLSSEGCCKILRVPFPFLSYPCLHLPSGATIKPVLKRARQPCASWPWNLSVLVQLPCCHLTEWTWCLVLRIWDFCPDFCYKSEELANLVGASCKVLWPHPHFLYVLFEHCS